MRKTNIMADVGDTFNHMEILQPGTSLLKHSAWNHHDTWYILKPHIPMKLLYCITEALAAGGDFDVWYCSEFYLDSRILKHGLGWYNPARRFNEETW